MFNRVCLSEVTSSLIGSICFVLIRSRSSNNSSLNFLAVVTSPLMEGFTAD